MRIPSFKPPLPSDLKELEVPWYLGQSHVDAYCSELISEETTKLQRLLKRVKEFVRWWKNPVIF